MILVTGAAGFIGYNLINNLLKKKYTVIGVDSFDPYYDINLKKKRILKLKKFKNFKFQRIDISNKKKVDTLFFKNDIKNVVNLAAQAGVRYSLTNPDSYIKNNIVGFHNILINSVKKKVKHFLYASTSSVYGMNKKMPFHESHSVDHPIQLYAATKRSNELFAHAYSYLYDLPTTGLRFFTVYGPWGRPDMALFKFTKNIMEGKFIEVFNNGNHVRDFTYIDDIVHSIELLVNKAPKKNKKKKKLGTNISTVPFQLFNIGNSKPVNLMDYIKEIEFQTKKKAKIKFKKLQKGDVKSTYADSNNLYRKIKFKPKVSIKEGIQKFVNWYKDYYKIH